MIEAVNFNNSFRRISQVISPFFYVHVRRAFGDRVYFDGFIKDVPPDSDWIDLVVIELSGGADCYKGQTLKLCKGHPIEYLDIALGDIVVNERTS